MELHREKANVRAAFGRGAVQANGRPMSAPTVESKALFEHAPPIALQRHVGLIKPDQFNIGSRALLVLLIGWMPIVVLTLAAAVVQGTDGIVSLLRETGVHARYLVAAPLLILAERQCASHLTAIVRRFSESGLVREPDRARLRDAVESTRARIDCAVAEVSVVVIAYLIVAASVWSHPADAIPAWHKASAGYFSPAGWWHVLVSLPLLLTLILGWMWRLVLWAQLLWRISRLDLQLVASHPDHAAGLGFVGHSLRAFSFVAFALTAIAAGRSAHIVLEGGGLPTSQLLFNAGLLATIAILFTAPLAVFLPVLLKTWRQGVAEYGALARDVGDAFERRWLRGKTPASEGLEKPDFSATTDLYGVVSNVYALRFVPVDITSLTALVVAMLLPFAPVVLLAIPPDAILSGFRKLLF